MSRRAPFRVDAWFFLVFLGDPVELILIFLLKPAIVWVKHCHFSWEWSPITVLGGWSMIVSLTFLTVPQIEADKDHNLSVIKRGKQGSPAKWRFIVGNFIQLHGGLSIAMLDYQRVSARFLSFWGTNFGSVPSSTSFLAIVLIPPKS